MLTLNAMILMDKNAVRTTGALLLISVWLMKNPVVKLMEIPMLEVPNSMKMINAVLMEMLGPKEYLVKMMLWVAAHMTLLAQKLLIAADP